jgi:uncharacterized protein YneF (UPF0154 family)
MIFTIIVFLIVFGAGILSGMMIMDRVYKRELTKMFEESRIRRNRNENYR